MIHPLAAIIGTSFSPYSSCGSRRKAPIPMQSRSSSGTARRRPPSQSRSPTTRRTPPRPRTSFSSWSMLAGAAPPGRRFERTARREVSRCPAAAHPEELTSERIHLVSQPHGSITHQSNETFVTMATSAPSVADCRSLTLFLSVRRSFHFPSSPHPEQSLFPGSEITRAAVMMSNTPPRGHCTRPVDALLCRRCPVCRRRFGSKSR